MTQKEKIQILQSSIEANMDLTEGEKEILYHALLEGQMKIVQAEAEVLADGSEIASLYQIIGFVGREEGCEAKCQKLLVSTPKITESKISAGNGRPFGKLMDAACGVARKPDNYSVEYGAWYDV